jgi:hypothetical protein
MDPFIVIGIAIGFTVFGYVWGKGASLSRKTVEMIVGKIMDNLEREGYLRSEIINNEVHYIKWPSKIEKDL